MTHTDGYLPIINDMTDLNEGLLVINNKTNLSEGLPIINNTSANITYLFVLSINALMTCMVDDLYDCFFNQYLKTYIIATFYDL